MDFSLTQIEVDEHYSSMGLPERVMPVSGRVRSRLGESLFFSPWETVLMDIDMAWFEFFQPDTTAQLE